MTVRKHLRGITKCFIRFLLITAYPLCSIRTDALYSNIKEKTDLQMLRIHLLSSLMPVINWELK